MLAATIDVPWTSVHLSEDLQDVAEVDERALDKALNTWRSEGGAGPKWDSPFSNP